MFQDHDTVKTLRNYGERLEVHSCRLRGNKEKLQQGKFCLDTRKFFVIIMMVKYWNMLGRAIFNICSGDIPNSAGNGHKPPDPFELSLSRSLDEMTSKGL